MSDLIRSQDELDLFNDLKRANPDDTFDQSKRRFLMMNAGLIAAGGLGVVNPCFAMSWQFDRFQSRPENTSWRILDAHDTGYVTSSVIRKSSQSKARLSMRAPNDGKTAFLHSVKKRAIVHPVRLDSARIPVNFKSIDKVLLRYHHWIEDHSYLPGKWISLQLGRGWIGRGHVRIKTASQYGNDGGSATTMHSVNRKGKGNGIRLLATHTKQRKAYGDLIGSGQDVVPTGRWVTVDIVIQKNKGYRLYVDGMKESEKSGVYPVKNWNACKAIWYRTRLMHGGSPSKLPAVRDYKEWFGGFFVGVA